VIESRADLQRYQAEDLNAHQLTRWRWPMRFSHPVLAFQRQLRRTEYVINCRRGSLWRLYRGYRQRRLRLAGMKLGFTISANIFGPGLSIAHWGTIVVNPDCRIGARCRIHPGVCLGWKDGKVYGAVVLGNGTKVGPNAVVGQSFPEGGAVLVSPRAVNVGRVNEDGAQHRGVA
jgi:serine O-acetyltransferase